MRVQIVAVCLLLILSPALGFSAFDFSSTYDLIEDLKDGDDKIYVLFFYASANLHPIGYEQAHHHYVSQEELRLRNDAEHDAIKSWADVTPDVYYTELDVVNLQFDGVLNELGVEKSEVFSWPVTVVMQNGDGYQVTGPNGIYFIKRIYDQLKHPENGEQVQPGVQQRPG